MTRADVIKYVRPELVADFYARFGGDKVYIPGPPPGPSKQELIQQSWLAGMMIPEIMERFGVTRHHAHNAIFVRLK